MKNPLLDTTFLHALDANRNRVTYARLTSLTMDGLPVERIEGVFTGGSITIDGSSAVRRICNLTMTTKNLNMNNIYWGLTTRVKVEIGLKNDLVEYKEYPDIIWFSQGVFIITEFKTSNQVNNYTITLQGKDKMCLLNGDVGGNFNAETDCGTVDWQDKDGNWTNQKLPIPQIIFNLVREYAQEPDDNIIVKDIEKGLEILRNNSTKNIYIIEDIETQSYVDILYQDIIDTTSNSGITLADETQTTATSGGPDRYVSQHLGREYYLSQDIELNLDTEDVAIINAGGQHQYKANEILRANTAITSEIFEVLEYTDFIFKPTTDEDDIGLLVVNPYNVSSQIYYYEDKKKHNCVILKIAPKEDAGYRMIDIYYPDELIAAPGETVCSIFDKIIKAFGVYEYFYDVNGKFVFQAKETYVNTAWNAIVKRDDETYVDPSQVSAYVQYNFEGSCLTTAYQNSPAMGNIKNDYTVWGKKKNSKDRDIPIHMRYAIDIKPKFYRNFEGQTYMTEEFYNEFVNIAGESQEQYRQHPLPSVLQKDNALAWWHIEDWYQYYQHITGSLPDQTLKYYQSSNSKGYTGRLFFTDSNGKVKLICATESKPKKEEDREAQVTYLGPTPLFIFDMQNEYPVGYNPNVANNDQTLRDAFQHRYNICGHSLAWFIEQMHKNNYESYVYEPYIPMSGGGEDVDFINPFTVKQVDWREIIFQMAKDYYAHHTEDDFSIKLRNNNIIKYKGLNLYPKGKTGYEQYYHDIEAFWRTLYFPTYEISNDNRIFEEQFAVNFDIIDRSAYYDENSVYDIAGITADNIKSYLYWNKNVIKDPATLYFWFDFFNAEALGLGPFSVPAIGARPKIVNNDKIKAIIYKGIPNIVYTATDDEEAEAARQYPGYQIFNVENLVKSAQEVLIAKSGIDVYRQTHSVSGDTKEQTVTTTTKYTFRLLTRSARSITAQEEIDDLLYNYSYCNETVTISTVPIYYLEPNTIISAKDEQRVVNGYYIMNKITLPLTYNGTTSITAIKVPERIY